MKELSIVITCRNQSHQISGMLSRLMDDALDSVELIVVDDLSEVESYRELDHFIGQWCYDRGMKGLESDITLLRRETWGGAGGARNLGADRASGRYLWFVDGDDEIIRGAPDRLALFCRGNEKELILVPYSEGHTFSDLRVHTLEDFETCPKPFVWRIAPWGKLVRRDRFVPFAERVLFEDTDWHYHQCDICHTRDFYRGSPVYIYWMSVPGSQMDGMRLLTDAACEGRLAMVRRIQDLNIRSQDIRKYLVTFCDQMLDTIQPYLKEKMKHESR